MMNRRTAMTAAALAVSLGASGAEASTVEFTITTPGMPTTIFMLPQMPVPDGAVPGALFLINNVPEIVGGVPSTDNYQFNNLRLGGGLFNSVYLLLGMQYYTGNEANPTFILGVFPNQQTPAGGPPTTVIIAPAVSAVPLPASWGMRLGGLGALGFLAHRSARKPAVV